MISAAFDAVLREMRDLHRTVPALGAFAPFPETLSETPFHPRPLKAAALFDQTARLGGQAAHPLTQALLAASPEAYWRDTYANTDIGQHFLDRFGCYCMIGPNAPWDSDTLWSFMVHMPAGLDYTWHHHPAEEIYVVIDGEAEFRRAGLPPERLGRGGSSFHASDQPHAMRTLDQPVVAYVAWRNGFGTPPRLTPWDCTPDAAGGDAPVAL